MYMHVGLPVEIDDVEIGTALAMLLLHIFACSVHHACLNGDDENGVTVEARTEQKSTS